MNNNHIISFNKALFT